jgi:nucleoside-diphosphate-sugar epimerase
MKNLVITGAGGYIGGVLVEEALRRGFKVKAIDRFFFGEDVFAEMVRDRQLRVIRRDIRDVEPFDLSGADAVLDLAALSNDPVGELDPQLTRAINCDGRINVLRCAREVGVKRYVLASSASVYGFSDRIGLTEDGPLNPQTEYARSMVAAEQAAFAMSRDDFCVSALRQSTIFGLSRRMRFDLVVNTMTKAAVETGRIMVTGGGNQWRPLLHVRDTARAFLHMLSMPTETIAGEVFNVGERCYTIREIAEIVKANVDRPVEVDVVDDTPDHRSYNVSFEKAARVLGFHAEHDVAYGVREIATALATDRVDRSVKTITINWYKQMIQSKELVGNASPIDGGLHPAE